MKSEERSVTLRNEGNALYKKGLNKQAIQKYFSALDIAPQDSAAYFQAMSNIAVALINLGFPQYAKQHLNRISEKSTHTGKLKQIEILSYANSELFVPPRQHLYKGHNKFYAELSSAVKVGYSRERGRHLIAAEDIPAGSVIGLEEPTFLVATRRLTNCSHCARILPLSYIPCEECDARFCNEECRGASEYFHWLMRHTTYVPDHSALDLAARVTMHFTREELESAFASQVDRADVAIPFDSKSFTSILRLQEQNFDDHNASVSSAADSILKCTKFLENMGYKECAVENTKQFLVSTLKSIIGRIELNAHLIYHDPCEWILGKHLASRLLIDAGITLKHSFNTKRLEILDSSNDIGDIVAVCLLPVASIANHSCVPNLITSFSDKDERCLVIRTSRDVFSGEELLHNYGPMLGIHSYEKRQVRLQNDFRFTCRCEACVMRGLHPVDRRLECRICCFCQADFVPNNPVEFRCPSCALDKNVKHAYRTIQEELSKMDAALEVEKWDWNNDGIHDEVFKVFEKSLKVYYMGHRRLEDFVERACLAAVKTGYFEYAEKYITFLSGLRKLIFGGSYCSFLANASLLTVVFEIIRMKNVPRMRSKIRLRDLKRMVSVVRSTFNKIYGLGSVRDYELNLLLEQAVGPQAISLILVPSSCYVYSTLYSDHGGAGKWIHLDCQQEAGVGG
ncbi:unnamed protein product [Enterobius vermicularis]|uniref:SET domain-containing protein n=1 Tax=Enterobius vermicularis TaxID=51028 RepID=A0A0N4V0G6_ENTVE|nr:unnamed protein product [Enterobius vermicularis]